MASRMLLIARKARLGAAGSLIVAASAVTAVTPNGTQWDGAQSITVSGYNFTAASTVTVAGVSRTVTAWTPTSLTVSIPGAETSGSPVRTAGAKAVVVSTGGAGTWTVDAWGMQANGTGRSRLFVASSANCNGAVSGAQFTPWTDLLGNGDVTQATAGREMYFYDPESAGQPAVYCDSVAFGDITGTNPFGTQDYLCVMSCRFYIFNDADNHRTLATSGASLDLRNAASTSTLRWYGGAGTGAGYVESASFTPGAYYRRVISLRRYNGGAEFSMAIHDTALATPATLGTTGASFGAPGTIWLGCAGYTIDGSGSRFKRIYIAQGAVSFAEEQRIVREALVTDGFV